MNFNFKLIVIVMFNNCSFSKRAILLLVLATVVLAGTACADDSTKLPSSKASVVLPLLRACHALW